MSHVVNEKDQKNIFEDMCLPPENLSSDEEGDTENAEDPFHIDVSDEENEDPELQQAIKKMKTLDKILALRISNEKEVKKRGKELHQRLWHELREVKPKGALVCTDEAENTRMFLALTPSNSQGSSEEVDFVPVFRTQVSDKEYDQDTMPWEESESEHNNPVGSSEEGQEERRAEQSDGRQCGAARGKQKQDFVKKNIELASGAGNHMLMTQEERNRLSELLRDMEEGGEDSDRSADSEGDSSLCAVPIPAGEGYTPEPAELDQLVHIDARLQLLLPVEDFLSVRSPYPDHSLSQGPESGCECGGDSLPGEKILQYMRERRGQETRLREIEQQLEILGQGQEMTSEKPKLQEEQLRSLLLDCELVLSRTHTLDSAEPSPRDPSVPDDHCTSLPDSTPRLSSSALSELLREAWVTPTPQEQDGSTRE